MRRSELYISQIFSLSDIGKISKNGTSVVTRAKMGRKNNILACRQGIRLGGHPLAHLTDSRTDSRLAIDQNNTVNKKPEIENGSGNPIMC